MGVRGRTARTGERRAGWGHPRLYFLFSFFLFSFSPLSLSLILFLVDGSRGKGDPNTTGYVGLGLDKDMHTVKASSMALRATCTSAILNIR